MQAAIVVGMPGHIAPDGGASNLLPRGEDSGGG